MHAYLIVHIDQQYCPSFLMIAKRHGQLVPLLLSMLHEDHGTVPRPPARGLSCMSI